MKAIGIIGLGSIGMRHARNLHTMGHRVVGCDPDQSIKEFNNAHYENIIERADAIVIAAPTPEHLDHLVMAVLAGKPCFIEKPIASWMGKPPRNLAGALHVAERDKIPLMVGYNLRFHSCVKKAKEWLDAGLIGDIVWANFTLGQFNERPDYLRDGVILNWSHELDLALYLCGPAGLSASSTHRSDSGQDDLTDILLTHKSGCRSTVHLDYITKPEIRKFTIVGTENSLTVDLVGRVASIPRNYGDGLPDFCFCGTDTWNDNYIEEMQAFIDRSDGKETIGCTGEEGLEVLKICLEVRKQAGLE